MPAQPFVGQVITVPVDDADAPSDEEANEVFGALFARLQEAGLGPAGPFWTTLRAGGKGTVELVCCWPTLPEVSEGACGRDSFSAVLPARVELVAAWRPVSNEDLPGGSLHPAVVGLFDAAAERGTELGDVEVRQMLLEHGSDEYVLEVSVTVSR